MCTHTQQKNNGTLHSLSISNMKYDFPFVDPICVYHSHNHHMRCIRCVTIIDDDRELGCLLHLLQFIIIYEIIIDGLELMIYWNCGMNCMRWTVFGSHFQKQNRYPMLFIQTIRCSTSMYRKKSDILDSIGFHSNLSKAVQKHCTLMTNRFTSILTTR